VGIFGGSGGSGGFFHFSPGREILRQIGAVI
jgi:hypothetical protein